MRRVSKNSSVAVGDLKKGEIVIIVKDDKEIPCSVSLCSGTSCSICAIDSECTKWWAKVSGVNGPDKAAAFIPVEDTVE